MTAATEPLSDAFGYGVASSRPAAGIPGRVYYATDTSALSRDNGTSWDALALGAALTVEEVDGSPTDSAITKIKLPNGTLSISGHEATYTPASNGLTVEEVDGSPTDSAITKIVFPNGTLGISSHIATYTPASSGGGGTLSPTVLLGMPTGSLSRSYTFASTVESWTNDAGTLTSTGSKLRMVVGTTNTTMLEPSGAGNFSDGEVVVDVDLISGDGAVGVIFRATDASNHYMFGVTSNANATTPGAVTLYKKVSGSYTSLFTQKPLHGVFGQGAYQVMVRFVGTKIDLFVNQQWVATAEDSTYSSGRVGLYSYNGTYDFDNVKVYSTVDLSTGNIIAASALDPVTRAFGTASTAYEFDTTSLTGLTAVGTATAEDANTSVPGALYIKKAATASTAITGRFATPPSAPWTAICKVSGAVFTAVDYQAVACMGIAEASPGKINLLTIGHNGDWIAATSYYNSPTSWNSSIGTDIPQKGMSGPPIWYAIVANSSTSFDYYFSFDGQVWRKRTSAHNPGFTVGLVGMGVNPENGTHGVAVAFDYLRIWNSALTLPGV